MVRRCFILIIAAACAHGQPNSIHPFADSVRDCQSLATLLAPEREPTPSMAPALWRVRACPVRAGEILATELRNSRNEADTSRLEQATWLTQYVHDAHVLSAALAVAADPLASAEARVFALRALIWSKAPGHPVTLQTMRTGPSCDPRQCYSTYAGHFYGGGPILGDTIRWPVFGAPMPIGYGNVIDSTALVVERSQGVPEVVRRAATIVRQFPQDRELAGR
jgi:hypothetical protein